MRDSTGPGPNWKAEVLAAPPLIAPARSYTWPVAVAGEEEAIERGALYVYVRPAAAPAFLATCALGFEDPSLPRGVWPCPAPDEICAVAGGYAYIANVHGPEKPVHLRTRPVVEVRPVPEHGLLLFAGFQTVLAWGSGGMAWETKRLTWEGVRLGEVQAGVLHGWGWDLVRDREFAFAIDLATGAHTREDLSAR